MHGPATPNAPDPASKYKTRLGVRMFLLYCVVYAGFVFTNVLTEGKAMQAIVGFGLNLAVVYGMGLIILALILALIYNIMCTRKEQELAGQPEEGEGD
jgi:formate-dependent nitrite reductase membrane component NrfD